MMRCYLIVLAYCVSSPVATAQETQAAKRPASLVLRESRTYQLDVQKVESDVHVVFSKHWSFSDSLPDDLVAAIKSSPKLKKAENELFLDAQGNPIKDSGYIRWRSENQKQPAALLWFINGTKRREMLVSIEMIFDHSLGQNRSPFTFSFDQLRISVDFKSSRITVAQWNSFEFPLSGKQPTHAHVEDNIQLSITGTLTEQTTRLIRSADRLLSEELSRHFAGLAQNEFRNESHHGITLGWLEQPQLRHQLILLTGGKGEFLYSVSGSSFPLALMRRQLDGDAWPLVLRGTEYVGSTSDGDYVYRPVEYLLSKRFDEDSPQ